MTVRNRHRVLIALAIGFFAVLPQLSAFAAIAFNAWHDLSSPTSMTLKVPFSQRAQLLRGELVYPIMGFKFIGGRLSLGRTLVGLECLNPRTGATREIRGLGADFNRGLISNGKQLWIISNASAAETDGTSTIEHKPQRTIGRSVALPFIYIDDGRLIKMPFHIEGVFEPIKRWLIILMAQGFAVIAS
jgi:hypothetical protein